MSEFTPKQLAYGAQLSNNQGLLAYVVGNLLHPWEMDVAIPEIASGSLLQDGLGVWKTVQNMGGISTSDVAGAYNGAVTTNAIYVRAFNGSAAGYMRSRNGLGGMPVTPGATYRGEIWAIDISGSSGTFQLNVVWFDADGAEISTNLLKQRVAVAQNLWFGYTGEATAPAGAAFACLEFRKTTTGNDTVCFQGAAFFPTVADNVLRTIIKNAYVGGNAACLFWCFPAAGRQAALESATASQADLGFSVTPRRYGAFHLAEIGPKALAQLNHPLELGDAIVFRPLGGTTSMWVSGVEVSP